MSAGIITTYGASRPVQLVPTEIWLTVMRNIMPEQFLWTTVPIPFSAYRRTMPAEFPDLRTLKGALRTLHSLALASKLFLASAIELLYEVVLIETESDAICLHNTLVRAQAHKHLATRTRHLILTGLIAPAFPFIAPIIRSMDSLSIFSAFPIEVAVNDNSGASMCWPGEIAVALQETCGHSLRKLHLHYNSFIFLSPSQLSDMLACMPRLQTLIIQEPALCRSLRLPGLSDLTFLVAQAGISMSPGVEALFSSLSHLYLEPVWWSFDPGDILQRLGPRLSNLTLDMTNLSTTTNAIRRFREHHLSFPVVTHVQLILPWLQRPNLSLLPPGVTHLAIWWDCPPPAFDDDNPEVLSWLLSLAVIFCQWKVGKDESALTADPLLSSKVKLDVIRFTNPAHAQWLRGILDINMSKLPFISEHGDLRIEGPTGELFPIFGG